MNETERKKILKMIQKKMAEDEYEKSQYKRVFIQRLFYTNEDLKNFIKEIKRITKDKNIKEINCSFEVIYKEKMKI